MDRFARVGLGLGFAIALAGPLTCSELFVEHAGGRHSTAATRPAPGESDLAAQRGWLGARFALGPSQTDEHPPSAARVLRVLPDLSGDRAGLHAGDLVVAVGSQRVDGRAALRDALAHYPPGAEIELAICRDGRHEILVVRLDTAEDVASQARRSEPRLLAPF